MLNSCDIRLTIDNTCIYFDSGFFEQGRKFSYWQLNLGVEKILLQITTPVLFFLM